jgi:hypothetical protein
MNTEATAEICARDAARHACVRLLIAAAALLFVGSADAQIMYSCITADGRRIDSDQIPPECDGSRRIHRHRRDGTPLDDLLPDPTPEEKKKREEEEKRKYDEKEKQREQERKDKSLLETYCSLDEIEAARARAVAAQQAVVDRALTRKKELQGERKKLEDEAEFYTKRDLPENLKRSFAANNESMKLQEKIIANAKAELERVDHGFKAMEKRFQELIEDGLTPCGGRKASR